MEHKLPQRLYAIIIVALIALLLFVRVTLGQSDENNVFLPTVLNDSLPSLSTDSPTKTPFATQTPINAPSTPTPTNTATDAPTPSRTPSNTASPTTTQTTTPDAQATVAAALTSIAATLTAEAPTPTPTVPTPTSAPCSSFNTVQFARPTFSVPETRGNAVISVTLAVPAPELITVNYATSDNTATAGSDYTTSSGTLTFNPGETVKTFVVPITNDNIIEDNEVISLTLSNPVCVKLGVPNTASLIIVDSTGKTAVQFAPTSYLVQENTPGGKVSTVVSLNHSAPSLITVHYATSDGTATAGQDYISVGGDLTFGGGELTKTIEVQIVSDNVLEPDETFNLILSNPSGAYLGMPDDKATVTIKDTSAALTVQFDAAPYTVGEADGTANITVKLSSPSASAVTVDYTTNNGTATSGQDYTATSGTLTFVPGETTKTFPITVIDDGIHETNETINLLLSNPHGATVGNLGQTTLTIIDNDVTE